jgi:hypothetical protein
MLNWQHLDEVVSQSVRHRRDRAAVYHSIHRNRTAAYLKSLGYRYFFFPTPYGGTSQSDLADVIVAPSDSRLKKNFFFPTWIHTVPLQAASNWLCDLKVRCTSSFVAEPAGVVLWKFRELGELATASGPKFVFAHFLVPHSPFLFDADCTLIRVEVVAEDDPDNWALLRQSYIAQLQCVNRLVLDMVDELISSSATPPIILLQSDHGYGLFTRPPPLADISLTQLDERFDLFAAYHLPEAPEDLMPGTISPVSLFPTLLRHYFGAQAPAVEDRSYYSSWERPYDFVDVTSLLLQGASSGSE